MKVIGDRSARQNWIIFWHHLPRPSIYVLLRKPLTSLMKSFPWLNVQRHMNDWPAGSTSGGTVGRGELFLCLPDQI